MSDDKGKKGKKSKKDEVKYFSSSESSVSSLPTQVLSFDSESTPADLGTFSFDFDSPMMDRQQTQEHSSEAQAACSQISPKPLMSRDSSSVISPRKRQSRSPPAGKDTPISPQKQSRSRSPSATGAIHGHFKTFTPIAEEERCLLDSESSESSIEKLQEPPQQKNEPVASPQQKMDEVAANLEKRRSSSLPTEALPEGQQVVSSDESKKRTKSDGQIKPSGKVGENPSPKKKSPLKKALEKCGKVFGFMKVHDKQVKKDVETHTVSDCIPELSEDSGEGRETVKKPAESSVAGPSGEPNVAVRAAGPSVAQDVEPMEEDSEQRNDQDPETPRRSRRLAQLGDKPRGGSSSKRKDFKK